MLFFFVCVIKHYALCIEPGSGLWSYYRQNCHASLKDEQTTKKGEEMRKNIEQYGFWFLWECRLFVLDEAGRTNDK